MFNKTMTVAGILGLMMTALPALSDAAGAQACDLNGTDDLSSSCPVNSRWENNISFALHYGTLASSALVIEVVRATPTEAQLEALSQSLIVNLQVTTHDFSPASRNIPGRVEGGRIVFDLPDANESSFYISMLNVRTVSGARLDVVIEDTLGARAFLLLSAQHR